MLNLFFYHSVELTGFVVFHLRGVTVDVGGVCPWSSLLWSTTSSTSEGEQQLHDLVHFFFHVTRLNFHIKSRNLGLPSERVASINMHSIAYLSPQLFRIVQRFPRTARGCVDWVRCSCSTPFRDRISAAPPCCSPDAHSLGILPRRVFGEQRGGAAEILSRNGVEHGPYSIYTFSGGIRTHLYLLEM